MGRVSSIIRNRPVCILAHGSSIQELEHRIEEFKDKDVCWVSLGLFPIMEEYILNKIDKKLEIVFDCASVPLGRRHEYELGTRFPRLCNFLMRKEINLWITTFGIIRDSVNTCYPMMMQFKDKIFLVDDIFPTKEIGKWMDVPNSITLLIATMLAGGARKIFIFGMDGYKGDLKEGLKFYYKPEEHSKERMAALGSLEDPGINRDSDAFETRFSQILTNYRRQFGNQAPIYNVSEKSIYTILPKLTYQQTLQEI